LIDMWKAFIKNGSHLRVTSRVFIKSTQNENLAEYTAFGQGNLPVFTVGMTIVTP
jgi:hypothetical protein